MLAANVKPLTEPMKKIIIFWTIFSLSTLSGLSQVNPNYHYVKGHVRSDGVYVRGHYKTNSNQTNRDNYSTKPNFNPWTGESGYIEPDSYYYQNYTLLNKSEYLSKDFNKAKELNDLNKYEESIIVCKENIKKFDKPFFTTQLLGWNYLALNKKVFALETFQYSYNYISQSYFSASILYLTYLLNNQLLKAAEFKKSISNDTAFINNFNSSLKEDIRRLNLTVGIPNEEILKLILDDENLYLNQSLISASYPCVSCKIDFITNNIVLIGEGVLKKRFFMKDDLEGPCIAVEIECPNIFRNSIGNILKSINFEYKGTIQIPVLRKKGDLRSNLTDGEAYIRQKGNALSGVIIYDLDLDGEPNSDYFTIIIRK